MSHPIQYQAPLFRRLAQSSSVGFAALFGCRFGVEPSFDPLFGRVVNFGIDLLDGYNHEFLEQVRRTPRIDRFFGLACPTFGAFWKTLHPTHLILHGWATAMMWQAAAAAKFRHVPYFVRAETPLFENRKNELISIKQLLKRRAIQQFVKGAAGALSLGTANDRFYYALGCSSVMRVPYVVDNQAIRAAAAEGRQERRAIREKLGVPSDSFVIVTAAKLILRKRPFDLIRVLERLPRQIHLVWIGSGELMNAVRKQTEARSLGDRIRWVGFQPASETWRIFGASDIVAMPAENEPWGLVINEAVAAGLPVIASDQCGAAEDLIVPGRTGEILPTGNLDAWEAGLRRWWTRWQSHDRGEAELMFEKSEQHSIETAAQAIERAVGLVN